MRYPGIESTDATHSIDSAHTGNPFRVETDDESYTSIYRATSWLPLIDGLPNILGDMALVTMRTGIQSPWDLTRAEEAFIVAL